MATVEELLETLISVQESSSSAQSSDISEIKQSLSEIKSGYQSDLTTPNYIFEKLDNINNSLGGYTSLQVQENNSAYYSDIVAIKELMTYQFIIFGAVLGFFVVWAVIKGLFKNVSS